MNKRTLENTQFDVIVLGGGAAGLMCAFTAAQRGRSVLVLEKSNKMGKKILMSGGGRCNFTNYYVEPDNFISENTHFCKSALNRFTQWDFISMVEAYDIDYEERKHSQLFCKNSAKDILAMLLSECESAGVCFKSDSEVLSVMPVDTKGYQVSVLCNKASLFLACKSLVVATGALSIPTLGGSGYGYDIAKQFGLNVTAIRAGLVPFMFSDTVKLLCEKLSGLSLEAMVECGGKSFSESVLFTHRGLSGPAILQISNYWNPGDSILIDLLPNVIARDWLVQQKLDQPKALLRSVLSRVLPKALVLELQAIWWPDTAELTLAGFSDKQLTAIAQNFNRWCVKPSATEGYRTAEVTIGGVDTSHISSKTMEVKSQQGLYFVGEVLDVTGHLGGFNFQWAWSSGYAAGTFA